MSSDFTVRGVESGFVSTDGFAELYGAEVGMSPPVSVSLSGPNRGSGHLVELAGVADDVVELETGDGIVSFERAGVLVSRARSEGAVRGAGDPELTQFLAGSARGGSSGLSAVRRYSVSLPADIAAAVAVLDEAVGRDIAEAGTLRPSDPARSGDPFRSPFGMIASRIPGAVFDPAARAAMRKIADWVDAPVPDGAPQAQRRKRPKVPGVYRVGGELLLEPAGRLTAGEAADSDPYLVLVHGTFSHTEGGFGQLRGTAQWDSMVARYDGRVLAVEHPTLGLTPAENAAQAARLLPAGARLHMVSHSRGGLVAEALSYCAACEPALGAYAHAPHPDVDALPELRRLLVDRGITVERFVRVACPARGTTLASRRLDRWASFLFNVFNLIPVMRETGAAALVKKFLLAMLDQRSDPRVVPGIETQMPESPFLRTLLAAPPLEDGLGSITGDVQGSGIGRRLLVAGADLFYREDHDFVVPTESMSGGITREAARSAYFQGPAVNHSAYFGNADSREALNAWLRAKPGEPVPGFAEPPAPGPSRGASRGSAASSGSVLVVPDLLGSRLLVDAEAVWPDVPGFVALGADAALSAQTPQEVGGLVDEYDPLLFMLETRFATTGWAYDPRRSLADAAAALGAEIYRRLEAGRGPVLLVTHGAGALVALAALKIIGIDDWRASGGRGVLISPPLDGTWLASAHLAGVTELCALLALLDHTGSPKDIGVQLAGWPSLHELDPGNEAGSAWRRGLAPLKWTQFSAVYGQAEHTIRRDGTSKFVISTAGDGHVEHPYHGGPTAYYLPVQNARLPSDPDVAASVLDLLEGRIPGHLTTTVPASGTMTTAELPDLRGELLLPTAADLVRSAWGGGRSRARHPALRVSVVHGDLRAVTGPILVGHQDGTPIAGAERALDTRLSGTLSRRLGLGAYPGPLGTSEVFGGADEPGSAVAVIGLGDAGDLTPAALTAAVTRGVLRLAATHLDRSTGDPWERMTLAAVLIGTNLIPPMPVENALNALVTGVRHANRRLHDIGELLTVDDLRIVELYEERSIQAVHAARRLPRDHTPDGDDKIVVVDRVVEGKGHRSGSPHATYQEGVWRTIRIVNADPRDNPSPDDRLVALSFTSIERSARAEQNVNTGQRELIDALVAEAIDNPNTDDQLFNTLYEMLVPNSLKGQGYGGENLMVVVDEQAAVLPLEMLATRSQEGVQPLAVDVGMVRRLETRTFDTLARQSAGRAALVISDPPGTGLPRLLGARDEARRVAEVLTNHGFDVTAIIPKDEDDAPDVVRILNALFRRSYRIVHMAGHGNYSATDPSRSGMVIGPDTYLTALEIAKMRTAPDLVFLNCCHLGAMQPRPGQAAVAGDAPRPLRADRLASSISRRLIDNGVRAVVAAGWAVDDRAAAQFAHLLYDRLLGGEDLGTATHSARIGVHRDHPALNTWGAYQVYGPPAMRLGTNRTRERPDHRPVGRREFRDALTALKRRAEKTDEDAVATIRAELETLLVDVPQEWLSGTELALLGRVWAALADYKRAVEALESLQQDWKAVASLNDLQELANIKAKWAVQQAAKAPETRAWVRLLDEADHIMELLIGLGPSPERLSLRAGVARRRARCSTDPDEILAALETARDDYGQAAGLHEEKTGRIDIYPALNHILFEWMVARRRGEDYDRTPADALIERYRGSASEPDLSFWSRVTDADVALTEGLISSRPLPRAVVDDIAERYVVAFTNSSSRERTTVVEHLDMIESALSGLPAADTDALGDLRRRLESWRPQV